MNKKTRYGTINISNEIINSTINKILSSEFNITIKKITIQNQFNKLFIDIELENYSLDKSFLEKINSIKKQLKYWLYITLNLYNPVCQIYA